MSTKNPFRTPIVTPNPTGISQASSPRPRIQIGSSPPLPSLPTPEAPPTPVASYRPPAGPPPGFRSSASTDDSRIENGRGSSGGEGGRGARGAEGQIASEDLDVEAPPAYTPAADINVGEATLELGPRRPFQQAPAVHHQPHPIPQQNQPYLSPQASGIGGGWRNPGLWSHSNPSLPQQGPSPGGSPGGWLSAYPGQVQRMNTGTPSNLPPPPPRHPQSQPSLPLASSTSSLPATFPPAPVSDFARDFYAAGAGDGSEENPRPSRAHAPPPGPPPSSSSPSQYAPPPGPPPNPSRSSGTGGGRASGNEVPDDGRPTTSPTPGHPLLLNGKLLVYPNGHECHKCNNTGFKSFDPSHPCRKCWDRYGKPYSGALAYTPWSSNQSGPSNSNTKFQRPLPSFRPPQAPQHPHSHTPSHNRSISNPTVTRAHTHTQPHSSYGPSLSPLSPQIHVASPYSPPPPGATIVQPGDHRIGGRLCYKCRGTGVVPFFLFDETTCIACGGVGRIFV